MSRLLVYLNIWQKIFCDIVRIFAPPCFDLINIKKDGKKVHGKMEENRKETIIS